MQVKLLGRELCTDEMTIFRTDYKGVLHSVDGQMKKTAFLSLEGFIKQVAMFNHNSADQPLWLTLTNQ